MQTYKQPLSEVTYSQLSWKVKCISSFLLSMGLKQGDKIMILGDSSPNWVIAYLGATYIGCVGVTVLPNFSKNEVEAISKHSEASIIFVSSTHMSKVVDLDKPVVRLDDLTLIAQGLTKADFNELLGINLITCMLKQSALKEIEQIEVNETDLASIIYTSGTTGEPKGVMLTHKNILWSADTCSKNFIKIKKGWTVLSILPLAHVYEFTCSNILTLLAGCNITFLGKSPSVSSLLPALKDVKPRIMMSIPLLIEKIYSKAIAPKVEGPSKINKLLRIPLISAFVRRAIKRSLILSFGGKIKFFGIGGAPLDCKVEEFLYKIKFPYALGYGLTETSPLIAGCGPKDHKKGTIGRPIAETYLRFDEESNELLVKTPALMLGYYKNQELTKQVITKDGFFKTGDKGYLKGKRLVINGRIKDMILSANGENIFPEAIENVINHQNFVKESLIMPQDAGLIALIRLDLEAYAKSLKISLTEAKVEAEKYIKTIKELVNNQVSSSCKISKIELYPKDFERTPTQKLKRYLIIEDYKKTHCL